MAVIGFDTPSGSPVSFGTTPYALIAAGTVYTAIAGDFVDYFAFYGYNAAGSVDMAVYDFAGGVPVNRLNVPDSIALGGAALAWFYSAAVNYPLVAGTDYVCAACGVGIPVGERAFLAAATDIGTPPGLSDPWVSAGSQNWRYTFYAHVSNTPAGPGIYYPCKAQLIT